MGEIYLASWINCDYFYIGQTKRLASRKKAHISMLKNSKHPNPKLQNVFNKYGAPNFHVLEEVAVADLDNREQFYLDLLFAQPECLNLAKNVDSPRRGAKLSQRTKDKISKANKGRKLSKETKAKMSVNMKGKWNSPRKFGKDHPGSKAILQYTINGDFVKEWDCVSYAADHYGITNSRIISVAKQKKWCKSAAGFIWKYKEEGER